MKRNHLLYFIGLAAGLKMLSYGRPPPFLKCFCEIGGGN